MSEKTGAYATTAKDTDFRRKWDKEEYAERARKKDDEERDRMKENEDRAKQGLHFVIDHLEYQADCGYVGKRPLKSKKGDLPKPTELMKQREDPLELDKNLGKTMVVQNPGGRGPGQPGFYCETCNRTYKDTVGYLDHINSRAREEIMSSEIQILL